MAAPLTLYAETGWVSPWVFHVMTALEEKRLPYQLELVPLPIPAETKARLRDRALIGKVPVLAHGELWLTESLAISEYLAETFPAPGYPRLFPADLGERARARQVMSYLRTDLMALREARPAFGRKIKGFDRHDAVLTGVETRTSSPLKMGRDDHFQSLNTRGLYPAGEGASYAGGILSAGVDGIKVGEAVARCMLRLA